MLDKAIALYPSLAKFLQQDIQEQCSYQSACEQQSTDHTKLILNIIRESKEGSNAGAVTFSDTERTGTDSG